MQDFQLIVKIIWLVIKCKWKIFVAHGNMECEYGRIMQDNVSGKLYMWSGCMSELRFSLSYMLSSGKILFSQQFFPEKGPHSHCYMYLPIIWVHKKFTWSLNKWSFLEEEEGSSRAHALPIIWISFAMAQMHWIKPLLTPQRKEEKSLKS